MANWWEAGGATGAVAAYQPIGAASLAASYSNLCNPGTYDAAPGTAPSFDTATGWTFNGSTQYLTTGVTPTANDWSMFVRFTSSGTNTKRYLCGCYGGPTLLLVANWDGALNNVLYSNHFDRSVAPRHDNGVLAVAGGQGYRDGAADGASFTPGASAGALTIYIGAMNYGGSVFHNTDATIQAVAIFNNTLDAAEVAAVTAAMNALPTASSAVASIVQAHGLYLGASLGGA